MATKQLQKFFEEHGFNVHFTDNNYKKFVEVETWTDGGVNMVITLKPFTVKEFVEYVNGFDVDEEIDVYRQDKHYCDNFTIRESLKDFETYKEMLKELVVKLEKL